MGLLDDKRSAKQQPDEDLWEGLFGEEDLVTPAEPAAAPKAKKERAERQKQPAKRAAAPAQKPKRARARKKGLSPGQILILLLLGIGVVTISAILITTINRTLSALPGPNGGAISIDTPGVENTTKTGARPVLPTATPTRSLAAIATPTQTPTPRPPVTTQFDQSINADPDDVELRLQRGAEYLSLGAYRSALADFEHAQTFDDRYAPPYVGIGQALYYLLEWPPSESAFLTAVSFDEDLPEPYFGIGMLYYLQGRYAEAAKEFDRAAEKNPEFTEAEAWLAIAAARSGDPREAMAAAGRAISLTQDLAINHIARSWAYRVQNPPNIDAAQGDLLYAQKLAPYNLELLIALAQFYTNDRPERIVEAEQMGHYALQWAKNDLERARALHTLGQVYLAQNRKEDARKVLVEAAELTTYEGYVLLGGLVEDLDHALAP